MKDYIKALVNYGVAHDLIQEADSRYVYNRLLDVMRLERGGGTAPKGEPLTAILAALTDDAVSRGEFVTMALACAGIPAGDLTMTGFCDDAEIPTWAKGSAVSALQCGLIRGVGTEGGMAFCADEGVTLSEAATVLNRLLRVTDVDLSDYDAGSADAWSAQAVANLESVRVIESGSFSAGDWQRPLTRGEAAQLLSAAVTLAEKKQESAGLLSGLFQ